MRFKNLFILLIFSFGLVILTTCSEDGEGTVDPSEIQNIDAIANYLDGLNLVLDLENGGRLNFTLGVKGSEVKVTNFVDEVDGFNFTNANLLHLTPDGSASLIVDQEKFIFDYLLCTTVQELKRNYYVNFPADFANYNVYIAVEIEGYATEDILNGQTVAEYNTLFLYGDPDTGYLFGALYLYNGSYRFMDLRGGFEQRGNEVRGFGTAVSYSYDNNGNMPPRNFDIDLNCR